MKEGAPVSVARGRGRSFWREVEDARVSNDVTTRGPPGSRRKEGGTEWAWSGLAVGCFCCAEREGKNGPSPIGREREARAGFLFFF